MRKIVIFSAVPIDDAATLYRSGLVAKKLIEEGKEVFFSSVSANFKREELREIESLPVHFIGQAHYFAKEPFSLRKRLGLGKVIRENLVTCRRFARILKEEKPDRVLVVTTMPAGLMAGLVAKILGFKTYIDIEDLAIGQMGAAGYPRLFTILYRLVERVWLKIFDKVIVCSYYLKEIYPGSVIIPNMIEVNWWHQRRVEKNREEKKVVFVGQMGAYHGQMEVLDHFKKILKEHKNLQLIFVGGGEMLKSLKLKVKSAKLDNQVIFTGQVSQEKVKEILAASDVGLLPLWDTPVNQARHPLKLLEYLAAGLVVLTNKVGEAERIIKNEVNGIVCPPGDMVCLATSVVKILGQPVLAKKIRGEAVLSARKFSVEKILPKWKEALGL